MILFLFLFLFIGFLGFFAYMDAKYQPEPTTHCVDCGDYLMDVAEVNRCTSCKAMRI